MNTSQLTDLSQTKLLFSIKTSSFASYVIQVKFLLCSIKPHLPHTYCMVRIWEGTFIYSIYKGNLFLCLFVCYVIISERRIGQRNGLHHQTFQGKEKFTTAGLFFSLRENTHLMGFYQISPLRPFHYLFYYKYAHIQSKNQLQKKNVIVQVFYS